MNRPEVINTRDRLRKMRNEMAFWSSLSLGVSVISGYVALEMPKYHDGGRTELAGIAAVAAGSCVLTALKSISCSKEAESFNAVLNRQDYVNESNSR